MDTLAQAMADELFDIQDKSDLPERLADASSPAAAQDTGRPNTVISHAGSVSVHSMAMSFVVLVRCMRCTCIRYTFITYLCMNAHRYN